MLDRKYRPDNFEEFLGNGAEVDSLKRALEKSPKERPHFILFSGGSGCGKTTLARICAKMLGATDLTISEINAANDRGIDTAREIMNSMNFTTFSGAPRIFIIDEAHKTTGDFQNAMLKPLEDTPEHVYFFLCTTEPNKLINTVRTRAFHIQVKPSTPDELYRHLKRIAVKEGFREIAKEVFETIVENSQGSTRKAIKLLEKCMGLETKEALKSIGELGDDEGQIIDLCRALIQGKWSDITKVLVQVLAVNDPEKIRYSVMGYMSSILLKGSNEKAAAILECFAEPTYSTGKNGIVLASYQATFGG